MTSSCSCCSPFLFVFFFVFFCFFVCLLLLLLFVCLFVLGCVFWGGGFLFVFVFFWWDFFFFWGGGEGVKFNCPQRTMQIISGIYVTYTNLNLTTEATDRLEVSSTIIAESPKSAIQVCYPTEQCTTTPQRA